MKKAAAALLLLLVLGLAGAGLYWLQAKAFGAEPFGQGTVVVEIPHGAGPRALGKILSSAGAVADADKFVRHLRWFRRGVATKAGEYQLELPMTPDAIIDQLVRGEVLLHQFTVPEGRRLDEIAAIVGATGLCAEKDFLKLARAEGTAKKLGVPASSLEGYLFPETYSVPRTIGCLGLAQAMVAGARAAYREADKQRLAGVTLGEAEAMTLASIIEKETGQAEERPRISCVFHNRLKRGIKLQTDPTVIYATLLLNDFAWDGNIHKSDLERPHPYNTYTIKGLPPGPIASPGLLAIKAALRPLACQDIFFVSRNDHTHVFCPDLACHEANVAKFQLSRHARDQGQRR